MLAPGIVRGDLCWGLQDDIRKNRAEICDSTLSELVVDESEGLEADVAQQKVKQICRKSCEVCDETAESAVRDDKKPHFPERGLGRPICDLSEAGQVPRALSVEAAVIAWQ